MPRVQLLPYNIDFYCPLSNATMGLSERSFKMNVSLTPELEKIVALSGMYNSASEVVREGIRLLQQRDEMREMKLAALRRDIEEGVKASEEGRVLNGSEVIAEIKERLLQRSSLFET
jgi:antitoxin ParD1/3/4